MQTDWWLQTLLQQLQHSLAYILQLFIFLVLLEMMEHEHIYIQGCEYSHTHFCSTFPNSFRLNNKPLETLKE